ncbi:type II secretion system protein N [Pseudomonas sp. NPDC089554]|uniref:type II secretion system protein N n=1 Tax=Pseudomonas sp. NPDC089554 TaxID=3390653 RepID=UPI003D045587
MNWASSRRHAVWVALPALMGAFLLWREGQARAHWQAPLPMLGSPAAVDTQGPLPAATMALAFGFQAVDAKASTRSDITLKASFVSSLGEARALISNNAKDAIYRVGDRLPGGGVVRRIEARAITLWVEGREETLALAGATGTLLRPVGMDTPQQPASTSSLLLLRKHQ